MFRLILIVLVKRRNDFLSLILQVNLNDQIHLLLKFVFRHILVLKKLEIKLPCKQV